MKVGPRVVGSVVVGAVVLAGAFTVGIISQMIERDAAFEIDRFDQHVTVHANGTTGVVEDLDVTFSTERRGIFRDLDANAPFPSFGGFDDFSVDRGTTGEPWNFAIERGPTGPRIRIGEATTWLDPGTYRYRIGYTAPSWYYRLQRNPGIVEVRIDSPGYDWPTSIGPSTLTVEAPGRVLEAACVEGPHGSTRPCDATPVIDGQQARFAFGPFNDREAATVALRLDAGAFAPAANVPTYDPVPLGERRGLSIERLLGTPWPLDRPAAALLLAILLAIPILGWEKLSAWAVYRDRVTDPMLHDRQHPTALPAPPFGFRPPEIAGLRLKRDDDQLFLSTLVDLDQRDLIVTRTSTSAGGRFTADKEELTVTLGPGIENAHPTDAEVVHALLPGGTPAVFDGTYDKAVAERINRVKRILAGRRSTVFDTHGFKHDAGGVLAQTWFRAIMFGVYLVFAATLVSVVGFATPLHPGAGAGVAVLVMFGWGVVAGVWQHHRLPLNSEGRDAIAQARAFEEFIRTVEQEQLEWASGQPGIDHHHPAISLLPYAIALGLADEWYERFSSVMQELAVAERAGARAGTATAAGGAWWTSQSSFRSVSSAQSGTSTAPSSSGGSGGGGSGGGGGGGGSW
jgi:uncharacterized membrane protein YgcG